MGTAICTECGDSFEFEELPKRGRVCFRCHLGGIRLGFAHGKEHFHGPTASERRAEIERDAAIQGRQIERIPEKAWV